jgi:hypothetical protein
MSEITCTLKISNIAHAFYQDCQSVNSRYTGYLQKWELLLKNNANNRFPFDSLGTVIKRLAQQKLPMDLALSDLANRLDMNVAKRWPPP